MWLSTAKLRALMDINAFLPKLLIFSPRINTKPTESGNRRIVGHLFLFSIKASALIPILDLIEGECLRTFYMRIVENVLESDVQIMVNYF